MIIGRVVGRVSQLLAQFRSGTARGVRAAQASVRLQSSALIVACRERCVDLARKSRRRRLLAHSGSNAPITLFLAPEAGLVPFYTAHVLLARTVADSGKTVALLSCNGLQPICSMKMASSLEPTAPGDVDNFACRTCRPLARRVGHDYGLTDLPIEELLTPGLIAELGCIIEANASALWETTYDEIAFGRAALGETLRHARKVSIEEMVEADQRILRSLVYSSLAVYFALKELASRFRIERIVYFGDYAYYLPPQVFAKRQGIPLTHISYAYNKDIDQRVLVLWPGHGATHMLNLVDKWPEHRDRPLSASVVADVLDGALFRLCGHGGVSTYSPNWAQEKDNLIEELGLDSQRKTLVAYNSSMDEVVCNREFMRVIGEPYEQENVPFVDQLTWLCELIRWVGRRSDLQLIVRLHPRMGSDSHRHSGVASQLNLYRERLVDIPKNVVVIWPDSKLSSYNVAEYAQVVLTSWSNMGLELARFGVPVVASFRKIGPFPVGGFVAFEEEPEAYFRAIDAALNSTPSIDTVIEAYRWSHFLHWSSTIDISDIIVSPSPSDVPAYRPLKSADTIRRVMAAGEDLVEINMTRLPRNHAAAVEERAAIAQAVEECILFFMTGQRLTQKIVIGGAAVADSNPDAPRLTIGPGHSVSLNFNGQTVRRESLLVARLAQILERRKVQNAARAPWVSVSFKESA